MPGLLDKRLILVLGKGGVGRSTVAASIATATARAGRKTLLFEANAKDRYGSIFGKPPVGPEITELRENLFAINTTPAAALEEYGLMILRFRRIYNLVFENRITEAFLKAIPGIEDYAILGKVWYHTKETKGRAPVWDTIVFDMAASGHSLSMLRIPWAITSAVPEGPLTRDARTIQSVLLDKEQTGIAMVTMAEDMPSNEAIDLKMQLHDHLGMSVQPLIVNQLYDERFPPDSPQEKILEILQSESDSNSATLSDELRAVTEQAALFQARRLLNESHIKRLQAAFELPLIPLPRLFVPKIGVPEIEHFAELLQAEYGV
ncbi:MAG: ArsA family ATPase [Kofleriaceae bacterium]|nr:ArsA family ATPase [Kofleriaceae bacterium]